MAETRTKSISGVDHLLHRQRQQSGPPFSAEEAFDTDWLTKTRTEDKPLNTVSMFSIRWRAWMMGNDPFPEYGTMDETPQNIVLHLIVDDADTWRKRATEAGAEIVQPIKVKFWGDK